MMRKLLSLCVVSVLCGAVPVYAQVSDPTNDFVSTYTGAPNADVDVVASRVDFDGTNFKLSGTMAGDIGQTTGAFYVWGFNRGAGTARFTPAIPNTENILFDSVVIVRPDGSATISRIVGGGATNFAAGTAQINGPSVSFEFGAGALPSLGFTPEDYTWNLWPRGGAGGNEQVSDFAPNTTNAAATVAPEPASCALLLLSLPLMRYKKRK